ncbi:MAG: hypothetical protein H0W73_12150 [Bacteroidetes bacterium]|nr:hypothetical protein [Bacteroidota bacterium]
MESKKKLGVWMDHASAHLIEFLNDGVEHKTVDSKFTHQVKEEALNKSEHVMHNKEQHQQAEYYKKLGESIKGYDNVVLFGPTNAKEELFNTLKSDHSFEKIKIEVRQSDKMTENQQYAFVKDYFSNQ